MFVSNLLGNPEDKFSYEAAQIMTHDLQISSMTQSQNVYNERKKKE